MPEPVSSRSGHRGLPRVIATSVSLLLISSLTFTTAADTGTKGGEPKPTVLNEQKRLAEAVDNLKQQAEGANSAAVRSAYLATAAQLSMQLLAIDRAMAIQDKALRVVVYQDSHLLTLDDLRQGGLATMRAAAKVLPHNLVAQAVEHLVLRGQDAVLAHARVALEDVNRALRAFVDGRPDAAMRLLTDVEDNPMTLQLSALAGSDIPRAERTGYRVRTGVLALEIIAALLILGRLAIALRRSR